MATAFLRGMKMKELRKKVEWGFAFFYEILAIGMFEMGERSIIGGVLTLAIGFFVTPFFRKLIGKEDAPPKMIAAKLIVSFVLMCVLVTVYIPD